MEKQLETAELTKQFLQYCEEVWAMTEEDVCGELRAMVEDEKQRSRVLRAVMAYLWWLGFAAKQGLERASCPEALKEAVLEEFQRLLPTEEAPPGEVLVCIQLAC